MNTTRRRREKTLIIVNGKKIGQFVWLQNRFNWPQKLDIFTGCEIVLYHIRMLINFDSWCR